MDDLAHLQRPNFFYFGNISVFMGHITIKAGHVTNLGFKCALLLVLNLSGTSKFF